MRRNFYQFRRTKRRRGSCNDANRRTPALNVQQYHFLRRDDGKCVKREAHMCMITTAARCDEDLRGSSGGALRACRRETAEKTTNVCNSGTTDKETGTAEANHPPRRCSAAAATSPTKDCSNHAAVAEERHRGRPVFPASSEASPSTLNLKQRIQVIVRIRPIEDTAARCRPCD